MPLTTNHSPMRRAVETPDVTKVLTWKRAKIGPKVREVAEDLARFLTEAGTPVNNATMRTQLEGTIKWCKEYRTDSMRKRARQCQAALDLLA